MINKKLGILLIVLFSCITYTCKEGKSLQELLQEEKKSIDRFYNMNNFIPVKPYPRDRNFESNEYFRTDDGLFIHVVDSGNGKKAKYLNDVSVRYEYCQSIKAVVSGDTTKYYYPLHPVYLNNSPYLPMSFVYGISATYSSYSTPVCQAWVIPLFYVGEEAVLDLIVPSSLGSSSDNTSITPVFYKNLRYTRFN